MERMTAAYYIMKSDTNDPNELSSYKNIISRYGVHLY